MLEIVSKSNNLNIYTCGDSRLRGRRSKNPRIFRFGESVNVQICARVVDDNYKLWCGMAELI